MRQLASHVANIPSWTPPVLTKTSGDGTIFTIHEAKSTKELLAMFDKNAADARAAIVSMSDAEFMKPWSLTFDGKAIFTQPKAGVLRGFILNHLVHHRAQLGVYLRLNDVPVPAIYGPSADEQMM